MSDPDTKERRIRKRNFIAKDLKDSGERRGAFALKVRESKKGEYKRLNKRDIERIIEDDT